MRLYAFVLVDLLALAFVIATLWMIFNAFERQRGQDPAEEEPYAMDYADLEDDASYGL